MRADDPSQSPGEGSGRDETPEQRDDRNLAELLQELRVAGLGIQVLFGFLLSLPFTNRFKQLDHLERVLYMAAVFLAVGSIILLTAPVAYHRLLFRRHRKEWLVRIANRTAVAGLILVAAAVSAAVSLIVSFVEPGALAVASGVIIPVAFVGLWFVVPLVARGEEARERHG